MGAIEFDDSPKRVWLGAMIPGKKLVKALGYSGIEAGRELGYLYTEIDLHLVFYATALVMQEILKGNSKAAAGPAARKLLTGSRNCQSRYGAVITDVRDFLKLRYRAKGLDDINDTHVLLQVTSFNSGEPEWAGDPAMVVNFAITALDALSRTELDSDSAFLSGVRGSRELFRCAYRRLNPYTDSTNFFAVKSREQEERDFRD